MPDEPIPDHGPDRPSEQHPSDAVPPGNPRDRIRSPGLRALYDRYIGDDPDRVASYKRAVAESRAEMIESEGDQMPNQPIPRMDATAISIFARCFEAFLECDASIQQVVRDMIEIINDPATEFDDAELAISTVIEALFPGPSSGDDYNLCHHKGCSNEPTHDKTVWVVRKGMRVDYACPEHVEDGFEPIDESDEDERGGNPDA